MEGIRKGKKLNFLDLIQKKIELIINTIVLLCIIGFLFSYFKPSLLFSNTTISAGDTVGHYYGTYYMNKYLIPHGKIISWSQDWFLGYPAFQFYFPLTFFISGLLGYFIALPVSFKIITVLGTFLLPICTFFSFKLMGFKFPVPAIAASMILILLFLERISPDQIYSMWGGNIPSTLAGEFSYSLSLSLAVLFLGFLYKGIEENKYWIVSGILFCLVMLSHAIVAIFFGIISIFFLFSGNFRKNFYFLFKTFLLSFLLMGFWFIPMALKTQYTVPHVWGFPGNTEELIDMIIPEPLMIFYLFALVGFLVALWKKEKRCLLFISAAFMAFTIFILSPTLNQMNIPGLKHFQLIKFLPIMYLFILFTIPTIFSKINKIRGEWLIPLIVLFLVIYWVKNNVTYIPGWIKWNYEGYEAKPLWPDYEKANDFLSEHKIGRVAFEYDPDKYNSGLGSSRATETIPIFSGRPITEGTHFQSAFSGPYIYNAHCEYSNGCSCLFGQISGGCPSFNIELGTKHLELFNVKHFFVSSDKVKNLLKDMPEYERIYGPGTFEVWELKTHEGKYVVLPEYEPVLVETDDWRGLSYEWFRNEDLIDVPVVFVKNMKEVSDNDLKKFRTILNKPENLNELPKIKIESNCTIQEDIKTEEINIRTSCIDRPLWIKISYFPNWKVEGADKIYLVSPSFMMIFPSRENVRIYYGTTISDSIGLICSIIGILIIIIFITPLKQRIKFFKQLKFM